MLWNAPVLILRYFTPSDRSPHLTFEKLSTPLQHQKGVPTTLPIWQLKRLQHWSSSQKSSSNKLVSLRRSLQHLRPSKKIYLHLQQHPKRLRQFAGAMTNITRGGARSVALIAKAYPWAALAPGSTVVDVGGGNGHISVWLATEHAGLSFVVQDLPHASDDGIAALPAALHDRVRFVTHDFFSPQPVHGAEAYFFANVIHNWSDGYAVRILRALIPALKPGARVLVCDKLVPEPGTVPLVEEREVRASDLIMHILLNAKEHTEAEMRALFQAADKRFEYVDTHAIPHGLFKICEAVWKP